MVDDPQNQNDSNDPTAQEATPVSTRKASPIPSGFLKEQAEKRQQEATAAHEAKAKATEDSLLGEDEVEIDINSDDHLPPPPLIQAKNSEAKTSVEDNQENNPSEP